MTSRVELPARLDLGTVTQVAGDIGECRGAPLTLDGGLVQHLGGLGLQLLLAVQAEWAERRQEFRIAPRSAALEAALEDFGLRPDTFSGGSEWPL